MRDLKRRSITAGLLSAAVGVLFALGVVLPSSLIVFSVLLGVWVACVMEWTAIARPPLKGVGIALISLGIASFCVVYHHAGWQGCVYVAAIAAVTDTLAYIAGSIVGGPKLCPSKNMVRGSDWLCFLSRCGGAFFRVRVGTTFMERVFVDQCSAMWRRSGGRFVRVCGQKNVSRQRYGYTVPRAWGRS